MLTTKFITSIGIANRPRSENHLSVVWANKIYLIVHEESTVVLPIGPQPTGLRHKAKYGAESLCFSQHKFQMCQTTYMKTVTELDTMIQCAINIRQGSPFPIIFITIHRSECHTFDIIMLYN